MKQENFKSPSQPDSRGGPAPSNTCAPRVFAHKLIVLCVTLVGVAHCQPAQQWWTNHRRDAGLLDVQVDVLLPDAAVACVDDEALDVEYDKAMEIHCESVRSAIANRRSIGEQEVIDLQVARLRSQVLRCCVSRSALVDAIRPAATAQLTVSDPDRRMTDRLLGMTLCDPLTRELATRKYLENHSECILREVHGNSDNPVQNVLGPPNQAVDAGGVEQ